MAAPVPGAYLGPWQTAMIEFFRKNSSQLLAVNFFGKQRPPLPPPPTILCCTFWNNWLERYYK